MISFGEISQTLFNRGISVTIEEYVFCVNIVLGEDIRTAYAIAYDPKGFKQVLDTENEEQFLNSKKDECDALLKQQNIIQIRQEIEDCYAVEVQSRAMNLQDYRFTGGQIAQILQNLLHNRISDLDSASTKDVISLIKLLTEQFGLDGGSDFDKHFIQIYPKFNALCTNCNREFQIAEGIGAVCPYCNATYNWDNEQHRFIPQPSKL